MPIDNELSRAINDSDESYILLRRSQRILEYRHPTYSNALIQAARKANVATLDALCKRIRFSGCVQLNRAFDNRGRTALMNAVASRDVEKVRYMLKMEGVSVDEYDESKNFRAIDYCVTHFDADVFEYLVEMHATIEQYTWDAIIWRIYSNNITQLLLIRFVQGVGLDKGQVVESGTHQ